ncbi:hypothetical protein FF1_004737 [Malus domestica]
MIISYIREEEGFGSFLAKAVGSKGLNVWGCKGGRCLMIKANQARNAQILTWLTFLGHISNTGIDSPSRLDWLGIYSPPSSHHDNFIGFKFLSSAPTWKSGSGSISLPLVNLRFNYSFQIFRWNESKVDPNHLDQDHNPLPDTAHLLATSDDDLSFESGRVPDQIHLAYTDEDDEMRVMFVTPDGAREEEGLLW